MDDEYADIYFVDERNAVVDHRTGSGSGARPIRVTTARPSRTVVVGGPTNSRPVYGAQAPVIYGQPYPQSTAARMLGQLTTGQVVEMVAQAFAALQSLPAAPAITKDAPTDIANAILYQKAIAEHAKRDEQVRTLGALVARLVA